MEKNPRLLCLILFILPGLAIGQVNVVQQSNGNYYYGVRATGTTDLKYDVVFVGDGFTAEEQGLFNQKVSEAVAALESKTPFSERMCGFNIWRVNVASIESGVDHPKEGIYKDTELDTRYGNPDVGEKESCIRSDSPAKVYEAAGYAPDYDAVFVLVNDPQSEDPLELSICKWDIVYSAVLPWFAQVLTHEMAHKVGGLCDEIYPNTGTSTYSGPEPACANATIHLNLADIKWNDLIEPGTPLPTTTDDPVNVSNVIGCWEGAINHRYGIYRPRYHGCHMQSHLSNFCPVCERTLLEELSAHCTKCELGEESTVCSDSVEWARDIWWWARLGLRWPIPPLCLTCPPELISDWNQVIFEQLPAEGFELRIVDSHGTTVAKGERVNNGLQASFIATRSMRYWMELDVPKPEKIGSLQLRPRFFRDGKEVNIQHSMSVK